MDGDSKAGFSVFWADDGLDTGPLLLQKQCDVDINDTVDSLYTRFLLPEGIRGMVRYTVRTTALGAELRVFSKHSWQKDCVVVRMVPYCY